MKFRSFTKQKNSGFTIVELIVAIMVFSAFIAILMYLYSRSNDSFKITLWKQQRTAESERFWTHMRKHLEEATNDLNIPDPFVANPDVEVNIKPLKFHASPGSLVSGNIMAWNCSRVSFNFTPTPNHSVSHSLFFLEKNGRTIALKSGGKTISKVEDVENVEIKVTSIKKLSGTYEEVQDLGPDVNAVASIVEMSMTISPPKGYMAENLKITQNHKFRANVGASNDSAPSY